MLAPSGNQLIDAETTTAAANQSRSANILTLEISGAQHEPVLLSPGKWNVGSGSSNQIVLHSDNIAARHFLIVVTEHRSVIKDWSTRALFNGSPFDSVVLDHGDTVEVAGVRLAFRLAGSQDLISQLPYVSEPIGQGETASATENGAASAQCEERNTVHETADGILSFDESADRLDELISRIEASLTSETCEPASVESDSAPAGSAVQKAEPQFVAEMRPSDVPDNGAASPSAEHNSELAAETIDEELRQLEELRLAVRLEREQLLAKRELLIQESQQIDIRIAETRQSTEFGAANDENVTVNEAVNEDVNEDDFELQEQSSNAFGMSVVSENGAVAAEREKLRHYLEEFESVDDAECEQLEEAEVTVGAAQAVTDHGVMNALRSRDDAVKQLDDLVLAATGGLPAQSASTSNPLFDAATSDQTREGSGNFPPVAQSESAAVGHDDEQHDHEQHDSATSLEDADTAPDLESSVDEISELIDEVDAAELLADEELQETEANESESLADVSDAGCLFEINEQSPIETAVSDEAGTIESSDEYDLSALTMVADEDTDESNASLAENDAIPQVEFDDADSCGPLFGNAAHEESSGASDPNVAALSEPDDSGDMFTLHSPDIHEVVEEPFAEAALEVDDSAPELDPESEEAEHQPTNLEADDEGTDSNLPETGQDFEEADAGAPSWFDSKLLAGGDSEVEDESVIDQPVSDEVDSGVESEEAADPETDASAGDLRQKLAEMFDLPTLSENSDSVAADSSLESRLQPFRDRPSTEEMTEVDSNVPSSPWPDAPGTDTNAEHEPGLDHDPSAASDTESEFESETLDAFPAADSGQSADTTATSTNSSFEPEGQDEEEDSISLYMERLLARNRQVTGGSAAPVEEVSPVVPVDTSVTEPAVSSTNQVRSADGMVGAENEPEKWLDETPRHRQNRDQVRAEVQVLRQIANQSARSAVATASRRDVRKQVIVKTTASILALGSGVAALLLEISMAFGLVVLGIGIMFSIDLGLTIFRNWKQLRDLQKAAKALAAETSEIASEPEPVST